MLQLKIAGVQYPDNFYELFDNYDINDFIICFGLWIVDDFYNIAIYVTLDYFTPFHIMIVDILNQLYSYTTIGGNIIIRILGFLIVSLIGFMFLVFVEIIELNFWNISYNTKKNIELRSLTDSSIENNYNININDEKSEEEM